MSDSIGFVLSLIVIALCIIGVAAGWIARALERIADALEKKP